MNTFNRTARPIIHDLADAAFSVRNQPREQIHAWDLREFARALGNGQPSGTPGERPTFCGLPVVYDNKLPRGVIEFRDPRNGAVLLRVENVDL